MGSGGFGGFGPVVELDAVELGAGTLVEGVLLEPGPVVVADGLTSVGETLPAALGAALGAGALAGLVQPATSSSAARDRTPAGLLMARVCPR